MDGWDRNDPSPEPGPARSLAQAPPAAAEPGEDGETIFTVIAGRARSHSAAHLVLTAAIGFVDAAAIAWAHPTAWWVALLFAAAGAYGSWGLLDRGVAFRVGKGHPGGPVTAGLRIARETMALLGMVAVIAGVGGFIGTQFDGWIS